MEFLGGWNKEEDDEEGDGFFFGVFFFFFLGRNFWFGSVLSFTVLIWFWIVLRL